MLAPAQTTSDELAALASSLLSECLEFTLRAHFLGGHLVSHKWTDLQADPAEAAGRVMSRMGEIDGLESLEFDAVYAEDDECSVGIRGNGCTIRWKGRTAADIARRLTWMWRNSPRRARLSRKTVLWWMVLGTAVAVIAAGAWTFLALPAVSRGDISGSTYAVVPLLVLTCVALGSWAVFRRKSIATAVRPARRPFTEERDRSPWDLAVGIGVLLAISASAATITAIVNLVRLVNGVRAVATAIDRTHEREATGCALAHPCHESTDRANAMPGCCGAARPSPPFGARVGAVRPPFGHRL